MDKVQNIEMTPVSLLIVQVSVQMLNFLVLCFIIRVLYQKGKVIFHHIYIYIYKQAYINRIDFSEQI